MLCIVRGVQARSSCPGVGVSPLRYLAAACDIYGRGRHAPRSGVSPFGIKLQHAAALRIISVD